MTSYRTDRTEPTEKSAAGKAQRYHTDSEINLYAAYHAVHDEKTIKL